MLTFDFFTYTKKFITKNEMANLLDKKPSIIEKFNSSNMIGWTKKPSFETIAYIKKLSSQIKATSNCLVVVGIGGSFLGSSSYKHIFQNYFNDKQFEVIYAATTLSSKYLDDLLNYLEDKDYTINVISKSGSTLETTITYNILKEALSKKYSKEELSKRIIITTSNNDNNLLKEAKENNYPLLFIDDTIGGRYSFITPAHLLALCLNFDIDKIISSYITGLSLVDEAYTYACIRNLLFKKGYYVENFSVYEPSLEQFIEWLKQLFAETEGKNNQGLLPIGTINTRDLHSLGQFIQEGNKIIFETYLKITTSKSLIYDSKELYQINNIVEDSVIKAHYSGNIPCLIITMDSLTEENISKLISFFQLAASFSAYLFDVEPFNQPGVEIYKKEVKENLK